MPHLPLSHKHVRTLTVSCVRFDAARGHFWRGALHEGYEESPFAVLMANFLFNGGFFVLSEVYYYRRTRLVLGNL